MQTKSFSTYEGWGYGYDWPKPFILFTNKFQVFGAMDVDGETDL